MKIVLKSIGGPSPGLRVVGERESLLELAESLRAKVEQAASAKEEEIPLVDSAASDGSHEWISVQIVPDIQPVIGSTLKRGRHLLWRVIVGLALGAGILVLAYLGLMSLIR
jgi:hypothetical protein